jgi:hypothetical protein
VKAITITSNPSSMFSSMHTAIADHWNLFISLPFVGLRVSVGTAPPFVWLWRNRTELLRAAAPSELLGNPGHAVSSQW